MPAQPAGMGRPPSHRKPKTSPKHSGRRTLHSKFARSSHHHQSQASHESHPNPPLVLSPGSLLSRCRTNTLESCWNCPLEGQGPRRATALPHAGSAGLYQPVALWWSWRHCTALSMACLVRSVTPISNPPQNDLDPVLGTRTGQWGQTHTQRSQGSRSRLPGRQRQACHRHLCPNSPS